MYRTEIIYDRTTRDYALYLNNELVGFARTYHEAEITLDQLVFELMSGQLFVRQPIPENDPQRATDESTFDVLTAYRAAYGQARVELEGA